MTETIENLFVYLATYAPLVPICVFIWKLPSASRNLVLQLTILYCVVEFTVNFSALRIFNSAIKSNSTIRLIYSIFTATEYGFFASQFFVLIAHRLSRKLIIISSVFFFLFWTIFRLYVKYDVLDSVPIGIETILILSFAFRFLFEQMDEVSSGFIYNRYSFWITSGIMIYLSGSFFCYLYANQVSDQVRNVFWMFQNIFAIIKTVCFTIAVFIATKRKLSVNKSQFPKLSI